MDKSIAIFLYLQHYKLGAGFPGKKCCIQLLLMQTEHFPAAAASHEKHLTGETHKWKTKQKNTHTTNVKAPECNLFAPGISERIKTLKGKCETVLT